MDLDDELGLIDGSTDTTYRGGRPSFLTVLCILTFVGVGFSLIYGVFRFWQISMMEAVFDTVGGLGMDDLADDEYMGSFANTYRWMKVSVILDLVGAVFCLTGAIVMWNLRKIGFPIYVVGQALPIIGTVLTYGSMFGGGMFADIGLIFIAIGVIFPIGFIIMYGLNYKYLR